MASFDNYSVESSNQEKKRPTGSTVSTSTKAYALKELKGRQENSYSTYQAAQRLILGSVADISECATHSINIHNTAWHGILQLLDESAVNIERILRVAAL
jgi:hypothetical protein